MTWTAILTACLFAGPMSSPVTCRTHTMLIATPMPTAAYIEAQIRGAEWLVKQRGLQFHGLTIRPGRNA